jgi:hypothetical protein
VRPQALAQAGFFYFNQGDRVQCVFCLNIAERWIPTDVPMSEHRRLFPRCPFVLGLPVGNIPFATYDEQREVSLPTFEEDQVTSPLGRDQPSVQFDVRRITPRNTTNPHEFMNHVLQDVMQAHTADDDDEDQGPTELHVGLRGQEEQKHANSTIRTSVKSYSLISPARRNLIFYHHRWRSFRKWPPGINVSSVDLAAAGFFFTKITDQVACLHCGVHLRGWKGFHKPLMEHELWSPKCDFLIGLSNLSKHESDEHLRRQTESKPPVNQQSDVDVDMSTSLQRDQTESQLGHAEDVPLGETVTIPDTDESMQCKICFDQRCQLAFISCGHVCTCLFCGLGLVKCPICRADIASVVKVYL